MMCYICNDVKRAENKKTNARRVLCSLERLVHTKELMEIAKNKEYAKEITNFQRLLSNSKSNVHFMCGRCVKFNDNDLKLIENNINEKLSSLLMLMIKISEEDKEKAKKMKINLCSIFRGHYPIAYRLVEKTYIKECNKEARNEVL